MNRARQTRWLWVGLMWLMCLLGGTWANAAQSPPGIRPVDDAWRAALPLDAQAATRAYLDRLSPEAVARSNAYYEGGYWLMLWNWLAGLAVALLLMGTRTAARVRAWLAARLRRPALRDAAFGAFFALASWVLVLPVAGYQGFWREHQYGMSTQTLSGWLGDQAIELAVSMVLLGLLTALFFAMLRRAGGRWWLPGTAVVIGFLAFTIAISPVLIEPLFNTYKPLPEGPLKASVLAMAHANGVPVDNVYVVDASRQSTRVSANVSGLFGTAQVRLNDNLLNRSSEAEVRAVMAHEIGHYVLDHVLKWLVQMAWVVALGLALTQWVTGWLLRRWGLRWGIDGDAGAGGQADVACLPVLVAVASTYFFLTTPLLNTISRAQETEADLFGLNLAREPHGEAEVLLKLVEYRKPEPGWLEEIVFYTHPSARTRIGHAMRWREQMSQASASAPADRVSK